VSFILDALRRAERERNLGQAPRLEDVALAASGTGETPPQRRKLPWLLLAAGLLLIVAATLFLWLRKPAAVAPPAPVESAAAPAPAVAPAPPAAVETAETMADAGPPAIAEDEAFSTLDELAARRSAPPPTARPAMPAAQPEPEMSSEMEPAMEPAMEPEAPPPESAASVSRLQLDPAPQPAVPLLQEMPPAYRADFPAFTLDVHVWDEAPERRFVLVAGRRYREGETLAQGPRLVEITPEGVVLDYRGERVLYALER
jgi:general secretion pathway protein B